MTNPSHFTQDIAGMPTLAETLNAVTWLGPDDNLSFKGIVGGYPRRIFGSPEQLAGFIASSLNDGGPFNLDGSLTDAAQARIAGNNAA